MKNFKLVVELIREKFDVYVEHEMLSNVMFLRVEGLDNDSLARYIVDNFKEVKVTVKEKENYKFSSDWIKVEYSDNKELVLTK